MIDINELRIKDEEIVFYPYRQAIVYGIIEIQCKNHEDRENYIDIIETLCKRSTKIYRNGNMQQVSETNKPYSDNHICFTIGENIAIMFSDGEIRIGNDIKIGNW